MKTVILAGGYGTRIRDVNSDLPKPMIPIGNYPILWHIMKYYACFGMNNFVLCLGYKSDTIKTYFLNYNPFQYDFVLNLHTQVLEYIQKKEEELWQITFAETGLHAQTGYRVYRIKEYVDKDPFFLLTYGDGVGDINIKDLIEFHKSHGKIMTVTGAHPPGRFGELEIEGEQVSSFNEKPQSTEGWISAGYFVCSREIFDYLYSQESLVFEKEPMNSLVKDGQLMVYKHKNFWHPMDTSRDHTLLNDLWNQGKAPWKIW